MAASYNSSERDFMRHIARDIPHPVTYAEQMALRDVELLLSATFKRGGWSVITPDGHRLRAMGLMEYGGNCLTAFGLKVRRALVEDGA